MEAQFFKKFYTEAHKIVMDYNLMISSIKPYKYSLFQMKNSRDFPGDKQPGFEAARVYGRPEQDDPAHGQGAAR